MGDPREDEAKTEKEQGLPSREQHLVGIQAQVRREAGREWHHHGDERRRRVLERNVAVRKPPGRNGLRFLEVQADIALVRIQR